MKELEKRIAALESRTAAVPVAELDDARDRIFSGFRHALLEISRKTELAPCESRSRMGQCSDGPSFEELLRGMWERLQKGTMNEVDRQVLAAIPVDDLNLVGISAVAVVNVYKRIFDDY